MIVSYMDESGSKSLKETHDPYHVVTALAIRDFHLARINRIRNKIVEELVPKSMRLDFEFKGRHLFKPSSRGEPIPREKRLQIVDRVIRNIVIRLDLPIFYGAVHRSKLKRQYSTPYPPTELAFTFCAERVEQWFRDNAPDEIGLLVADDTPDAHKLRKIYKEYRTDGVTLGRQNIKLSHLIDSVFFCDSIDSIGVQVADVCAYFIARKLNGHTDCKDIFDLILPNIKGRKIFPAL